MSYEYFGYSSPHYILDRNDQDNNSVEYYYLMSDQGTDVHRVSSDCVKNVSAGLVPCNVMSGDYHGTDSDDYWSRVHAPIADGSCAPVKTDCTGYDGDTQEHGFEVDGSVYSDDKGVTVGEKGEPTDNDYLFINKYGSDINIPNTIIGEPPNLNNNEKYKNLTLFKTYSDTQERDFSINNATDAIINGQGQLDINIYVSRGRLSIDWDHMADTYTIYDGADKPCSPEGGDASYLTWNHECAICNARADFARYTSYKPIVKAFECYNEPLPAGCTYWGEKSCHLVYWCDGDWSWYSEAGNPEPDEEPRDPRGREGGGISNNIIGCPDGDHEPVYDDDGNFLGTWTWYQSSSRYSYYDDAEHPCGPAWTEDADGMLEQELYRIHMDDDFVATRTITDAADKYHDMCFNDCNEGTTTFEEGHPTSASCKDLRYDSEGGRWSDLHHLCGATDLVRDLRTPLNKSS